jgi:hypothetical protein
MLPVMLMCGHLCGLHITATTAIWGRCYDHNFLRFLPIFAKKLAFFSKTNVMIKFLHNLALFRVKNANFFAEFFGENILKIITSVPGGSIKKTETLGVRGFRFISRFDASSSR